MSLFSEHFNLYSLLIDLAFASGFILIGQFFRTKFKFFQRFFVPASLIGGFLGLILGPNGIPLYFPDTKIYVPFSQMMGSYAGVLIIIVFSSVGIRGFEKSSRGIKADVERIGSYLCYRQFLFGLQYFLPLAVCYFFMQNWSDLHPGFGMLLPAGFVGGHGTAAAVGETFAEFGWQHARDLAMTSATIGILVGIFGGVFMIQLGASKGYTSYIKDFHSLPDSLRTGLIPEGERNSIGSESVSPISIDPLAWHFGIILLPAGLGWIITNLCRHYWKINLPSFAVAFLVALCFFVFLKKTGSYNYVDRRLCARIGSLATDYLVFFGVASIKVPILIEYFVPFAVLMIVGIVTTVWGFWWLAPYMMPDNWFERGIFTYGVYTGVFAIGFVLLRIVDPDNRSKTLDDVAITAPISNITEILSVAMVPVLLSTGQEKTAIVTAGLYSLFFLVLPTVMKWWYFKLPKARTGIID